MTTGDIALERGLPANVEAERLILGAILTDEAAFLQVGAALDIEDFSLEKHRRIFARMRDLNEQGKKIERLALIEELKKRGQLESVDGIGYMVSLDEGMPPLFNLEGYVRLVKDKSALRQMIVTAQSLIDRCMLGMEEPDEILATAEESLLKLGDDRDRSALSNPRQIIEDFQGGLNAFLDPSQRIKGVSTGYREVR